MSACYACGLLAEGRQHGICRQCLLGWVRGRHHRCCPQADMREDGSRTFAPLCDPIPGTPTYRLYEVSLWRMGQAQAMGFAYIRDTVPHHDMPVCVIT